jgi:LPXTG-motif cell wall-anchored protein
MNIFTNVVVLVILALAAWFLGQKKKKKNPHSRKP